jgi:hypothetical protein
MGTLDPNRIPVSFELEKIRKIVVNLEILKSLQVRLECVCTKNKAKDGK